MSESSSKKDAPAPKKGFGGDFTSTGTASSTGEHTQIGEVRGNTKAIGQLLPILQVSSGADQGRILSLAQFPRITIGRSKDATLVLYDPSCSRNHAEVFLGPDNNSWIKDMGSTNGSKVNGEKLSAPKQLADGDRIQLGDNTILRYSLIPEDDARVQMDVYHRATRDSLTNSYNRRQYDEFMSRELAYLKRGGGQGLGLVMFDVDHFKKINDSFGHLAGDEVLRELGRRVPGCIRAEDFFARIGGEEFAIITRSDTLEGMKILAERIRQAMESAPASFEGRGILFTVSVGYTYAPNKSSITSEQLVAAADEALYEAKHGGRNRSIGKDVKTS
ncbi:MAG: GGDEF domain-containing protein [Bdellovibrionales bacterium]|nr:GGDEF domain-containing protein [Bdellovibrionales bacterium]